MVDPDFRKFKVFGVVGIEGYLAPWLVGVRRGSDKVYWSLGLGLGDCVCVYGVRWMVYSE